GNGQSLGANIVFDFPFAFPMRDSGVALRSTDRAVDQVLDVGFLGDVRDVLALQDFAASADGPKILDTVDAVDAYGSASDGGRILQVTLHEFDTQAGQRLRRAAARITRQCSQLPALRQHVANDGPALASRSAGNEHELVCVSHESIPPVRWSRWRKR